MVEKDMEKLKMINRTLRFFFFFFRKELRKSKTGKIVETKTNKLTDLKRHIHGCKTANKQKRQNVQVSRSEDHLSRYQTINKVVRF